LPQGTERLSGLSQDFGLRNIKRLHRLAIDLDEASIIGVDGALRIVSLLPSFSQLLTSLYYFVQFRILLALEARLRRTGPHGLLCSSSISRSQFGSISLGLHLRPISLGNSWLFVICIKIYAVALAMMPWHGIIFFSTIDLVMSGFQLVALGMIELLLLHPLRNVS